MKLFKSKRSLLLLSVIFLTLFAKPIIHKFNTQSETPKTNTTQSVVKLADIPPYQGQPYVTLQNNKPNIDPWELSAKSFERYSALDKYGRPGVAVANVGTETMPKEKRGPIGQVKPPGWQTVKYDNVDGKYLYNRCHLIGYQLTGENANERNLITGTRYLNVDGMLPFENQVADYVKTTGNHVLYRVTPMYKDNELVARGVIMEAMSAEDKGKGLSFCVYVYNVQPGIEINYQNGKSKPTTTNYAFAQQKSLPNNGKLFLFALFNFKAV